MFEPGPRPEEGQSLSGQRRRSVPSTMDQATRIRLGEVVERLDPATQRDAVAVLMPFARALEPDERIEQVAQGWTKGLMCLVARTDRRVVVVVDRFPAAVVESLGRDATAISVYGPPGTDRVSLAVVDGRRLLEVTGVRDRDQAVGLASPSTTTAAGEYF